MGGEVMNTYQYYVNGDSEDLHEAEVNWNDEFLDFVAQECAEDWFQGGNPEEFELAVITQSGEHKRFRICVEFEPSFYSEEVK